MINGRRKIRPAAYVPDYADWEAEYGGRKAAGGQISEDVRTADHDRNG